MKVHYESYSIIQLYPKKKQSTWKMLVLQQDIWSNKLTQLAAVRQALLAAGAAFDGVVREILVEAPSDPLLQGMDLDP